MMNNTTMAKKAISMINRGMTLDEVVLALNISKSKLYDILRRYYDTDWGYKRILKRARENAKAKREAEKLISPAKVEVETVKEVIVVETGYLMARGVRGILDESLDIFIPAFNLKELEKLANSYEVATQLLDVIRATNSVTPVNLRKDMEVLGVDPFVPVKNRTIGIVAVCCYLWARGYKVRLLTNSSEVKTVAELQGIGIDVIKVDR